MSTTLALIENALSIGQVLEQRKLVMSLMKEAMTEDQHYGKIPGCGDKPTLLQPGAQLITCTFRLAPEYEITASDLSLGHREYRVKCKLTHGGALIAEGVGLCSSMESKHRFRNSAAGVEDTGDALPKAYWDWKEKDGANAANKKLGEAYDGARVGPKKIGSEWHVAKYVGGDEGKVENPNPSDTFNTVLKMAKKRAYVDATITATACSDLFTQDLEDIRDNLATVEVESVVTREPLSAQDERDMAHAESKVPLSREQSSGFDPASIQGLTKFVGLTITDCKLVTKPTWTAWFGTFSSGMEAGTFDKGRGEMMMRFFEEKIVVTVMVMPGKKGKLELSDIMDELP